MRAEPSAETPPPGGVGVFGGTFNPVHLGHLRAAEEVADALGLERVWFVPARVPPHKGAESLAPAEARWGWLRESVAGNPRFGVSDRELRRAGPSYTVDTLAEFRREMGRDQRLWFLMGADAFREIHTWHRYPELFALADLAVMRRPPDEGPLLPPPALREEFEPTAHGYRHASGREVRVVRVTPLEISSSTIRALLAQGRSVRYLVAEPVRASLERAASQHPEWFRGSAR
ncbi:nicotinate-nucleotide adenylyltransferase [Deferrisoma camini]|uniref:nicotinate-nucleotide adenylyltransferase n=1 Tax=Deferrisoma camini TaxID=1035120 RepID=UPI000A039661|nr:nicotinate-nucleotide adenylyltransferase [Deferrisoma camini]